MAGRLRLSAGKRGEAQALKVDPAFLFVDRIAAHGTAACVTLLQPQVPAFLGYQRALCSFGLVNQLICQLPFGGFSGY